MHTPAATRAHGVLERADHGAGLPHVIDGRDDEEVGPDCEAREVEQHDIRRLPVDKRVDERMCEISVAQS
jgi:hypothetical protein